MIKYCTILLTVISFFACSPRYVAIYRTDSTLENKNGEYYKFENDTLLIKYTFWKNQGGMIFSVYNKLSVPIYIDWKRSNFISNNSKFDYWSEREITKGKSTGAATQIGEYRVNRTSFNSETIRPERVTFLPPQTIISNSSYLLTFTDLLDRKNSDLVFEGSKSKKNKKSLSIYKKNFTKENSPLVFRNFLTYSTFENFNQEKYISHEFYVKSIEFVRESAFAIFKTENGKSFYTFPSKTAVDFYRSKIVFSENPVSGISSRQ